MNLSTSHTSATHKLPNFIFRPMLDNKELNSTLLTLVIIFDPKHFAVEKSVRKSIISLRPDRQYAATIFNETRFIENKDEEVTCEALVTVCHEIWRLRKAGKTAELKEKN